MFGRKSGSEKPNDYPRIYLFGDSLTERGFHEQNNGFGWQLQEYYQDRVEVVNEGYSGQTSHSLREQFKTCLLDIPEKRGPPAPLLITIFLGANDACLLNNGTYVALDKFEEYIRGYINSILEHPATQGTKIVLISTPPVDVPEPYDVGLSDKSSAMILRSVAMEGRGHRTWESKRRFAKKIVEIGKEFEAKTDLVALLDFWTVITKFACKGEEGRSNDDVFDELDLDEKLPGSGMPGGKEFGRSFFTDGLHFGEAAYKVLGRELLDLMLRKWPELDKAKFPLRD